MVCLPAVNTIFHLLTVAWEMEMCCWCLVGNKRPIVALRRWLVHSNVGQLLDEVDLEIGAAKISVPRYPFWMQCAVQLDDDERIDGRYINHVEENTYPELLGSMQRVIRHSWLIKTIHATHLFVIILDTLWLTNMKVNILPSHLRVLCDEDAVMATLISGQYRDNSAILPLLKEDPIIVSDVAGSSSLGIPLELFGVGLDL